MEGGWPFMPAWCLICAALLACLSPAQPTKSLDLSLTLTNNVIHVNDVPEHLLTMYPVCTRERVPTISRHRLLTTSDSRGIISATLSPQPGNGSNPDYPLPTDVYFGRQRKP